MRTPFRRRQLVTDEPFRIACDLMHWPLATPWRRGAALAVDLTLYGVVFVALVVSFVCFSIDRERPEFIPSLRGAIGADTDSTRTRFIRDLNRATILYVSGRRPASLPDSVRAGLERGEREQLEGFLDRIGTATTVGVEIGDDDRPLYDEASGRLVMKLDMFLGPWSRVAGGLSTLILYFTVLTWWMRGRTPGKALWRIRVVRLDGQPLTLWDTFERAGGYGASLSTAGLGFLEAFWHPNRQTVHDRISGTVVIRTGKKAEALRERNAALRGAALHQQEDDS